MHLKKALTLSFIFSFLMIGSTFGQQWASDMFEIKEHDFGSIARGSKSEFRFPVKNLYTEDVHISSVSSSCGCTQPRIEKQTLKTYETGAIIAKINTNAFLGSKGATLTVYIDKPYPATVLLNVRSYIRSDVVFTPGSVGLGDVKQGDAVDRKVQVTYAGRSDWKIDDITSDNPHIAAIATEVSRGNGQVVYDLDVHVDGEMPVGPVFDHLVLVTNDRNMPKVPLSVDGTVNSSISVSPSTLFMGVLKPGQKIEKKLVIRGEKPFSVTGIETDGGQFTYDKVEGSQPKKIHVLPIRYTAGDNPGKVSHKIQIATDLGGTITSTLPTYAVVEEVDENDPTTNENML
ncbi:MAG: DUF1573 domain-containing protein [Planctomycetia bacterium]|jgi:hypothetical protein